MRANTCKIKPIEIHSMVLADMPVMNSHLQQGVYDKNLTIKIKLHAHSY